MLTDIKTWLVVAVVVGMVIPSIINMAKAWVNKDFKAALDKSLTLEQVQDPGLRKRLQAVSLAVVDLQEYITPDRGTGQDKFAKADAALASIPLLAKNAGIRKALIEGACELMWSADDVMKAEVKEHKAEADAAAEPPAAPPAA